MEEKKEILQFDASLGGNEALPHDIHILKYAAARSKEIAAMTECIINPCHNKLIFQLLPAHMRRRVMSHNSKRLPRRLRPGHDSQLQKSGPPIKQKRPSRKHRRRPANLMEEYKRRQKNNFWLETHIWHAKRFHMTKLWGWRLPEAPCDKAFRACYRAGSKHCLLQDLSYYPSIHLSGDVVELLSGFKRITSSKCGLGITSQAYLSSKREGSTFIFNIDTYPQGCIGKVSFFWKPCDSPMSPRSVWIFSHPSCYDALLDVLCRCFLLFQKHMDITTENSCNQKVDQSTTAKRRKLNESEAATPEMVTSDNTYINNGSIVLRELKHSINRFRLTGPLSQAILNEALAPLNFEVDQKDLSNWFTNYSQNDKNKKCHQDQTLVWSKYKYVKSPAELPCRMILSLNVKDPRTNIPSKRKKAEPQHFETLNVRDIVDIPEGISSSAIWNQDIRNMVSKQKVSNLEINKMCETSNLVPGCPNNFFQTIPGVPVLLIQRPGSQVSDNKRIGYNSGWDIIIPEGYAMPFWMALVLRGARVGGLREFTKLTFESGQPDFYPDTHASQIEDSRHLDLLRNKYFRLPPNKRVNFAKLSINSPFLCRWQILLNNWSNKSTKENEFFVLRDKPMLTELQSMVKTNKIVPNFNWSVDCLVPVKLFTCGKGMMSKYSLICVPTINDYSSNKSSELVEPHKIDKNQRKRLTLRLTHKKLLKQLRRKSVRAKKKILENSQKYVAVPKQNNTVMIEKYLSEIKELWLPSNIENVKDQCSREVMGYVTHGDFSFTEAQSCGVGYITLSSLYKTLQNNPHKNKKFLVLTRSTLSRQYRLASLEIICDP